MQSGCAQAAIAAEGIAHASRSKLETTASNANPQDGHAVGGALTADGGDEVEAVRAPHNGAVVGLAEVQPADAERQHHRRLPTAQTARGKPGAANCQQA